MNMAGDHDCNFLYTLSIAFLTSGGNGLGSGQLSVLDGSSDFRVENLGIQINSKNTATFENTSAFIYALHEKKLSWNGGMVSVES